MQKSGETKARLIYQRLRSDILSGALPEGQRVVTTQVARMLGTSQIPVREALRQLEAEGLVQIQPHAGATVTRVGFQATLEIVLVQAVVEALATRFAAPYITPLTLEELDANILASEQALAGDNTAEFHKLNRAFHAAIFRLCPYEHVRNTVITLLERHQALRRVSPFTAVPQRIAESIGEHRQIVALLRATPQDLDLIERTLRVHKLRFVQSVAAHAGIAAPFLKGMNL